MVILGIGNVLQKDDGIGVYTATYLQRNFTFKPEIEIINGGVEGINLFNVIERTDRLLILDAIEIEDEPGSIYLIPSHELSGHGLNSGGAHEIGVLQVLDMLELQEKPLPDATVLGIVPHHVTFDFALSDTLQEAFEGYVKTALRFLEKMGIAATPAKETTSLETIIQEIKRL